MPYASHTKQMTTSLHPCSVKDRPIQRYVTEARQISEQVKKGNRYANL